MKREYENGSPMDQHIRALEKLMKRLNDLDAEIESISSKIFSGNVTDIEMVRLIEKRNGLHIERQQKEIRLKEQYKVIRTNGHKEN